jgi:hypothetical protein
LSELEVAKLVPREYPLFMKDDPVEIFLEGESSFFVRLEEDARPSAANSDGSSELPVCEPDDPSHW